jgi:branched-subunit amino acid permease
VVSWAIAWVPMAGPTLGAASFTIVVAAIVLAFALAVAGVVNALGERMAPLFLVGRRGERLFVRLYPEPVVESSS